MFVRPRQLPSRRDRERDAELRILQSRLSIAKMRRDKVAIQNLQKEMAALHCKYFWTF